MMETRIHNNKCNIIKQNYFRWLYEFVSVDKHRENNSHRELLKILHKTSFYCRLSNDDNRVEDGKKLRETFAETYADMTDEDFRCLDGPCSMLEMMVALSNHMDFQLYNPKRGEQPAKWFWELIKNLDLIVYTDEFLSFPDNRSHVEDILNNLLERRYGRNGYGGLFPLKRTHLKDQRNIEMWYQMMAYLDENYFN